MGHNWPPAVQKKAEDANSLGVTAQGWYVDARSRDCLGRELPKNGDIPKSPLSENGSLMPSAGTISI
jgi:hypothetical protein